MIVLFLYIFSPIQYISSNFLIPANQMVKILFCSFKLHLFIIWARVNIFHMFRLKTVYFLSSGLSFYVFEHFLLTDWYFFHINLQELYILEESALSFKLKIQYFLHVYFLLTLFMGFFFPTQKCLIFTWSNIAIFSSFWFQRNQKGLSYSDYQHFKFYGFNFFT